MGLNHFHKIFFIFSTFFFSFSSFRWEYLGGKIKYTEEKWAINTVTGSPSPDFYPVNEMHPGARHYPAIVQISNDRIALFAGHGYAKCCFADPVLGFLNDLYVYDIPTNKWAWIGGTQERSDIGSITTNLRPSGRAQLCGVSINQKLYFFGGASLHGAMPLTNYGESNAVWEFNLKNYQWEILFGDDQVDTYGSYSNNIIGSRQKTGCHVYTDDSFFVFGGYGYTDIVGFYGDVWLFNVEKQKFKFFHGKKNANNLAVYGVKGVANKNNVMGARRDFAYWSKPGDRNVFYLFGGAGYGEVNKEVPFVLLNDLWRFHVQINGAFFTWIYGEKGGMEINMNRDEDIVGSVYGHTGISLANGDLFQVGGLGLDNYTHEMLNDVWIYSLLENEFFFQGVNASLTNKYDQQYLYHRYYAGLINVFEDLGNNLCLNNVYLFGGTIGGDRLNDLWRFQYNTTCPEVWDPTLTIVIVSVTVSIFVLLFIFSSIVVVIKLFFLFTKKKQKNINKEHKNVSKIVNKKSYIPMEMTELDDFQKKKFLEDSNISGMKKVLFDKHSYLKGLFFIPYEEIRLEKYITSGGSGCSIFYGHWKEKEICFKSYKMLSFDENLESVERELEDFQKEITVFLSNQIKHPNILQLYGCIFQNAHVGLVLEWCLYGDLRNYLTYHRKDIELKERIRIMFEIAKAMRHLHQLNIIHRDLKLQNVLVDEKKKMKLMDFGLSKAVSKSIATKTMRIGTKSFQAPELIIGDGKYDSKVDVFSFSIVSYSILSLNFNPFQDSRSNNENIELKISTDENFRPNLNNLEVDNWLKELLCNMWKHNSNERPTFEEICKLLLSKTSHEEMEKRVKKDEITIYLNEYENSSSQFDGAEDFSLSNFSKSGLVKLVEKKWGNVKVEGLFVDGKEIKNDSDVLVLQNNDVIKVKFEKSYE